MNTRMTAIDRLATNILRLVFGSLILITPLIAAAGDNTLVHADHAVPAKLVSWSAIRRVSSLT